MDAEAVQILREIRDEVRRTNEKADQTNARLDQTNAELHQTNGRLGAVETTLLDLAQQQRFVVRHLKALVERDHRFEDELSAIRTRIDRIEERLGPDE